MYTSCQKTTDPCYALVKHLIKFSTVITRKADHMDLPKLQSHYSTRRLICVGQSLLHLTRYYKKKDNERQELASLKAEMKQNRWGWKYLLLLNFIKSHNCVSQTLSQRLTIKPKPKKKKKKIRLRVLPLDINSVFHMSSKQVPLK